MQILSTLILQFIFIYLSLIIGVPGTDNYNIFKNKLILFCGIFIFETIIKALYKSRNHCKNNFKNFITDSFLISILSIVGYSLYIDLSLIETTKDFFFKSSNDPNLSALLISGIICSLILLVRTIQLITRTNNECEQNEIY
jgi:Na+/H+-translocating membrane pyrophosphatase